MLGDAQRREKSRVMRQNFTRLMAAVKFAQQTGDGPDDKRIRITGEETVASTELRNQPQFGETPGNQICIHPLVERQRRALSGFFDEMRETILPAFQGGEFGSELELFFREVHGAETGSIHWARRLAGFRRSGFLGALDTVVGFVPGMAFVLARGVFPVTAMRFFVAWAAGRMLHLPRGLDAPQRAAKLFDLAFVGKFLALGQLDQFENLVQLINHLLE